LVGKGDQIECAKHRCWNRPPDADQSVERLTVKAQRWDSECHCKARLESIWDALPAIETRPEDVERLNLSREQLAGLAY
jgi:hypothetical protein